MSVSTNQRTTGKTQPTLMLAKPSRRAGANKALHADRGRTLVSRDAAPLQRPRRVNCFVRRPEGVGVGKAQKSAWGNLRLSVARRSFPAAEGFVGTLRQLHVNGGACIGSFRFPAA